MPRIRAATIQAHRAQTHADILDAAEVVFLRHGYDGTSLGEIADEAGLGRTTLYEYFPNKGELLLGLLQARVPPVLETLLASLPDAGTGAERLEVLVTACLRHSADHASLGRLLFQVGGKLPDRYQARLWPILDPGKEALCRLVRSGITGGEFPALDPEMFARLMADLLLAGIAEILRAPEPRRRLTPVVSTTVAILRRALVP